MSDYDQYLTARQLAAFDEIDRRCAKGGIPRAERRKAIGDVKAYLARQAQNTIVHGEVSRTLAKTNRILNFLKDHTDATE